MSEKMVQEAVEKLIDAGHLLECIEGKDRPEKVLSSLWSEHWLPNFPIDYMIRKRTAVAASRVLSILKNLKVVSTASRSISLKVGESLYPDLLVCNPELAAVTIFELKADRDTERQAITELLAYEHEVRNHLPFLANTDLGLVVISSEFSPLLNHSLASLITWQRRSILCLRWSIVNSKLHLSVHLPECWSPLGQDILPPGAIRVGRLRIIPKPVVSMRDTESAALSALQYITRNGERSGSHGFIVLCKDMYYPDVSQSPFFFLVGLLDPYVFLTAAAGVIPGIKTSNPLSQFLLTEKVSLMSDSTASFETLCEMGINYLGQWCDVKWDGFTTWDRERDPINRFTGLFELPLRTQAFHLDAWGDLGAYLQEMSLHPAIRKYYMPHFSRPGYDWTLPTFAFAILDWLSVRPLFPHGQITCRGIFHIGMRIGRLLCAYYTCEAITDGNYKNLPTALDWYRLDLMDGLRDILCWIKSSKDVDLPNPMKLGGPKYAIEATASLDELICWLVEKFIGNSYPVQQHLFQIGINAHILFDDYFWNAATDKQHRELHKILVAASKQYLLICLECIYDSVTDEPRRQRLMLRFRESYGVVLNTVRNIETARGLVAGIEDQSHIDRAEDTLLFMLDEVVPAVFHQLRPMQPSSIDWSWLREQIRHFRKEGAKLPGLVVWPNGEITTALFDNLTIPLPKVGDPENEVLVCVDNGIERYIAYSWEDLENGVLSRDLGE